MPSWRAATNASTGMPSSTPGSDWRKAGARSETLATTSGSSGSMSPKARRMALSMENRQAAKASSSMSRRTVASAIRDARERSCGASENPVVPTGWGWGCSSRTMPYDINSKMFRMYRDNNNTPDQEHNLADYLDDRDRNETERRLRVLEKLPKFRGTVFRGMDLKTEEDRNEFKMKWQKGLSPLTGFISTAYVEKKAFLYLKNATAKVILIIHDSSSGSYIGHLSSTPADEEVLFGCNQKFQMMTKEELGKDPIEMKDGTMYIDIKEK